MEKKSYLILDKEFLDYCSLNKIENIEKLAKEIFNKGFTQLKYGDKPPIEIVEIVKKGKNNFPVNIVETNIEIKPKKDVYGE